MLETNNMQQMHEARAASDRKWMGRKAALLGHLMRRDPGDWEVDSEGDAQFPGITHVPSGYRFHVPRTSIPQMLLDIDKQRRFS